MLGCAAARPGDPVVIRAAPPTTRPVAVRRIFPFPIVVEHGSAAQLGTQQAHALGKQIRFLHDAYLGHFLDSRAQTVMAEIMASLFKPYIEPVHLTEINALASATGISERGVLLGQCFLDLIPMSACSTVALPPSACSDGIARMGRNLDFLSLGVADKYTTVFVVRPNDGRYSFASIGWPGMIGVLSGMNQYGLTLANMEVTRPTRLPQAMPYTLLYRMLLERCKTVPEAIALLRRTPIQTANNLMLMDANGHRAVAELYPPNRVDVRYGQPGKALESTNHRGGDLDTNGRFWRYDRMCAMSQKRFGQFNTQSVEKMLGDVGVSTTLQSMVFEPTKRRIYLAAGQRATTRPYYRLDLKSLFAGGRNR